METEIIWESRPVAGQTDFARLVRNKDLLHWAIITTDCGRPQVILLEEQDVMRLAHHLFSMIKEKLDDYAEKAAAEMTEEYEKSEKDCMWEGE